MGGSASKADPEKPPQPETDAMPGPIMPEHQQGPDPGMPGQPTMHGGDSGKSNGGGIVGFFHYVFNFDNANKFAILNMFQYTTLSILPILVLLKGIKHLIPEDDDSKGSIEIAAESVGQLLFIMLAIWFINKAIFYIPTYSGVSYKGFNEITFILPLVLILATMQTKLGAKFQILIDRVMDKWNGREGYTDQDEKQQQQTGGGGGVPQMAMQQQMSPPAGLLPSPADRQYTQMPQAMATKQPQYQQPNVPQQMNMGGGGGGEPMAANEIGGSWGSSF